MSLFLREVCWKVFTMHDGYNLLSDGFIKRSKVYVYAYVSIYIYIYMYVRMCVRSMTRLYIVTLLI